MIPSRDIEAIAARGLALAGAFPFEDATLLLRPLSGTPLPAPWLASGGSVLPSELIRPDGAPYPGDPRRVLDLVEDRATMRGQSARIAATLVLGDGGLPWGQSTTALDNRDEALAEIWACAEALEVPLATVTGSSVDTLALSLHALPPRKAADATWRLQMALKGIARNRVPLPEAGRLEVHLSLEDDKGRPVFTRASDGTLASAIAGCLDAMGDCALLFSPPGEFQFVLPPPGWTFGPGTSALAAIAGPDRRQGLQHRAAHLHASPHLVIAAILAAALSGIADERRAPLPVSPDHAPPAPPPTGDALSRFLSSGQMKRLLPRDFLRIYGEAVASNHALGNARGENAATGT